MERNEVLKALTCCNEFLCGDCPYKAWDSDEYKLRCIHMLISDLHQIFNLNNTEKLWLDFIEKEK